MSDFEFERVNTIKGYPELHWTGKRPYRGTDYYPAQLKEKYGEMKDDWINKIFWGDNLQVMSHMLKEYRGKIDLIYIDPPFDSKADYKKTIKLRGQKIQNDNNSFEEKQYGDIWTNDEYLQFMYERIILMKELLSDTGSIILQCDWRKAAHLRCILDEVFGVENFRNEIIWENQGSWVETDNYFPRRHQNIFFYSKTDKYKFKNDYNDDVSIGINYNRWYNYIEDNKIYGKKAPYHDKRFATYVENFKKQYKREPRENDIIIDFKGSLFGSVWYIKVVDPKSSEYTQYPTQKPEKLIERFVNACTEKGDIVFDCFMGSGTTQVVAMKSGRKFIGADINLGSIQTTTKRLMDEKKDFKDEEIVDATSPQSLIDELGKLVKEKFYNNSSVSYNEIIEMITNNISIYEPKAKDILVDLRMHMIDIFTSIFKDYNIMIVPKIDIVEMPYPASDDSNRGKKKKEVVISDILIFNKEDL